MPEPMTDGTEHNEEDIVLAGEYVLGLLPSGELRAFEQRLLHEQSLRRLVVEWDESFAPMAAAIPEVAPPPALQARIERRLFGASRRRWPLPWIGTAAGGLLAALVLVGLLFLSPPGGPEAPPPTHVAQIAAQDRSLLVSVALNDDTGDLEVTRTAGDARPGRALELWLIADGADAPVSLGLLSGDATTQLTLSPEQRSLLTGAVLAISDEPQGGSPTGLPTGDVLATGEVTETAQG